MNLRRIVLPGLVAVLGATAQTPSFTAAEEAFRNYDFDRAEELLDKYAAKRKRDRNDADMVEHAYREGAYYDRVDDLRRRIDLGRNMLQRVEKLQVIDTVTVSSDDFFSYFRLDPSTGRLTDVYSVPAISDALADRAVDPVFVAGDGDLMLWVDADDAPGMPAGLFTAMESSRLADGSWEEPRRLFTRGSIFADDEPGQIYTPFLMADGVTLYFAADGPQSLGGLDIFIARREGNGEFLQPSNIGMPYNSPDNDFMMVVDEATGAGWWASQRGCDEDHVKIFVFKPSELRINYEADMEGIAAYAMLDDFTSASGDDSATVMSRLRSAATEAPEAPGFRFAMPDGRVLTSRSQFRSPDARALIDDWLRALADIDADRATLARLRLNRAGGDRSADREILSLEESLDRQKASLKRLVNDIVRSERN